MNARLLTAIAAAAATLAVALPAAAAQDTGNFLVRVRATHLKSYNGDGTGLGLTINNKVIPEIDFSYFFTPNLAAELVLTVPQKQTVHSSALNADIGTFKHLPPTLLGQYHFTDLPGIRPYVGAGINYTSITKSDLAPAAATLNTDVNMRRQSWGLAAQVGVDVPVGAGFLLNLDVKKVDIGTNVVINGGANNAGAFKVDPWLVSFGIGKRF